MEKERKATVKIVFSPYKLKEVRETLPDLF
jgi:hypothetical protein